MLLADATTDIFTGFFEILVLVALFCVMLVPYWMIVKKAGYSGWLSLLMLVPLVNVIMIWVFAFSAWPNLRRQTSDIAVR